MHFLPFKDSANSRSHGWFTKANAKYTKYVNVISSFPFMVLLGGCEFDNS